MLPKQREARSGTQLKDDNVGAMAISTADNDSNVRKERPQCGKFIYVTRNKIDVVASFYHHLSNKKEGTYTDTFETFLQDWMDGKLPFGSSLHHLISYAGGFADNLYDTTTSCGHADIGDEESNSVTDQPLLLLSYEKMKSNLRTEALRIISSLHLTHIPSRVLEEEILQSFEFSSMKNNIEKFQPKWVGWLNGFQFLRKGVTGDGRRLLLNRSTNDCGGREEEEGGESSVLMDAYNDRVEREEYLSKISNVLQGDCYEDCREIFLSVVGKYYSIPPGSNSLEGLDALAVVLCLW
ncbi:sulfotransferase family protein [Skeletonema marinoi]|uniref:Sulfotransferase family protein n=1 Tax=Skeletonema marinoi TaxID=267567 RepID=A0AAD8XS19_9STRA|nr:sulfotransferase family protein [Skeletonema marinoi]